MYLQDKEKQKQMLTKNDSRILENNIKKKQSKIT